MSASTATADPKSPLTIPSHNQGRVGAAHLQIRVDPTSIKMGRYRVFRITYEDRQRFLRRKIYYQSTEFEESLEAAMQGLQLDSGVSNLKAKTSMESRRAEAVGGDVEWEDT